MKLAWVTDIHLEFLEGAARAQFSDRVRELEPDGVLVDGDTALAQSLEAVLREMARRVRKPRSHRAPPSWDTTAAGMQASATTTDRRSC